MPKFLTEDVVRDMARDILGLTDTPLARAGTGQITTFNQLGFLGVFDKPDGWYLPFNQNDVALILEAKSSKISLGPNQVNELLKNIRIVQNQYSKVIGILYNGDEVRVFKGIDEYKAPSALQDLHYYLSSILLIRSTKSESMN